MPGMDRWREAIELLLTRAHASKRGVERQGLAAQEQTDLGVTGSSPVGRAIQTPRQTPVS